jgi:hypothetical protein
MGLGLLAPQLGLGGLPDLALGATDGGDAGDGGAAEVGTVATLGRLVGDGLVGLAGGALGTESDDVAAGGGLVREAGLLAGDNDTTLSSGLDTDGLLVDETGVLAAVLVGQVERVTGELNTTVPLVLGEVGVVVAYKVQCSETILPKFNLREPS